MVHCMHISYFYYLWIHNLILILPSWLLESLNKLQHLFRGPASPLLRASNVFTTRRAICIARIAPGANPVITRACQYFRVSVLFMTHSTLQEVLELHDCSPWERPHEPQNLLWSPAPYRWTDSEISPAFRTAVVVPDPGTRFHRKNNSSSFS